MGGKATRYGQDFVKVIKAYVDENEIERPEDLRIRTVANKSKLKISIIQAIDRKIDLGEIADINGIDFDRLLDEIEGIVGAGTRLNLSYFIDDFIDPEDQEGYSTTSATVSRTASTTPTRSCVPTLTRMKYALCASSSFSDLGN